MLRNAPELNPVEYNMGSEEANAAGGQKLRGFDSGDGIPDQISEFPSLFVRDCGSEVLDLAEYAKLCLEGLGALSFLDERAHEKQGSPWHASWLFSCTDSGRTNASLQPTAQFENVDTGYFRMKRHRFVPLGRRTESSRHSLCVRSRSRESHRRPQRLLAPC